MTRKTATRSDEDAKDEDAKDEDAAAEGAIDEEATDEEATDEDAIDEDVTGEDVIDTNDEAIELVDPADGNGTVPGANDIQSDDSQTLRLDPTAVDDLGPAAKIQAEDGEKTAAVLVDTEPEPGEDLDVVPLSGAFEEEQAETTEFATSVALVAPASGARHRHGHSEPAEHRARRDRDDRLRPVWLRHPAVRRTAGAPRGQHGDGAQFEAADRLRLRTGRR